MTPNLVFYGGSQTWSYSSNMQLSTQDREQRHRTQNIDGMDFPTCGDLNLTDQEIEELSQIIVLKHMETIAIKYLRFSLRNCRKFEAHPTGRLRCLQQGSAGSVEKQKSWGQPGPGECYYYHPRAKYNGRLHFQFVLFTGGTPGRTRNRVAPSCHPFPLTPL